MQQSPSGEANKFPGNQGIPGKPEINFRVHRSQPTVAQQLVENTGMKLRELEATIVL
jgi:hypothetical protein